MAKRLVSGVLLVGILITVLAAFIGLRVSDRASGASPIVSASGDVDCSGAADSVDALQVLRYVASLPVEYPPGCPLIGTTVDIEALVNSKFNKVDRSLALWNIQPGLGTVMIE